VVAALSTLDVPAVQRRTVAVLAGAQVFGGVGVAVGATVGSLLAAELSTDALAGLAASASVIGAALLAVPLARVMDAHGRRAGLVLAHVLGAVGAVVVVAATFAPSFGAALLGMVLLGSGTAANLQARYAATDLAAGPARGTALSMVVWATTIGAVLGPNLAEPVRALGARAGLPPLAGPFVLAAVCFGLAATTLGVLLRPDPLRLARALRDGVAPASRPRGSVRGALRLIRRTPAALLGLAAMAVGHAVMVGVMSMTPIHLHHGGASLGVVGVVISLHIAGMYAAAPLVGVAADRWGRRPVVVVGAVFLLGGLVIAGTAAAADAGRLAAGLFLLGLGYSCLLIAGSTLLTEAVPVDAGPAVQGTADTVMSAAGATAGLLAGLAVGFGSYAVLAAAAALLVLPLAVATLRGPRASLQA
jgi:MFS family permease